MATKNVISLIIVKKILSVYVEIMTLKINGHHLGIHLLDLRK